MSKILEVCESYRRAPIVEKPARSNRTVLGLRYGQNGVPWCGIAVCMAYQDSGVNLRKILTPNMASTVAILSAGKKKRWLRSAREAIPTDIVCYHMPGGRSGVNHVGIVKSVQSDGIWAYEGNTSERGSQFAGGAFLLKFRPWKLILGVVRIPFAASIGSNPAPLPPPPPPSPPPRPNPLPFRRVLSGGERSRLVEIAQWELAISTGYQFPPESIGLFDAHLARAVINLGKVFGKTWDGRSVGPDQWAFIDLLYIQKGHAPILT